MRYITICDDIALHREHAAAVTAAALSEECLEINEFSQAQNLLDAVAEDNYCPDIAVLDIKMDDMDGIRLAKKLNELVPHCQIIFLTAYLDYATEVYEAEHSYFVLKQHMDTRLPEALKKACLNLASRLAEAPCLTIKDRRSVTKIPVRDILYMERVGRKTRIVAQSGERWTIQSPAELLQELESSPFIRCHQSYWVNAQAIFSLKENEFILIGETAIPLSRTFRHEAKEAFFAQLHHKTEK